MLTPLNAAAKGVAVVAKPALGVLAFDQPRHEPHDKHHEAGHRRHVVKAGVERAQSLVAEQRAREFGIVDKAEGDGEND